MAHLDDYRRSALASHLRRHLRGEVHADPMMRKLYSTDASLYQIEPMCVVLPRTISDLQTTMQIAAEHGVPIVARGGGTSLSGQTVGSGIILDTSKHLRQVLDIDPKRRRVRVQPGVVLDDLNRALAPHGLQFGPDVSTANRATLGGMIGNNSAGAHSIIHGKTMDHVLALSLILTDGSAARCQRWPVSHILEAYRQPRLESAIYHRIINELPKHREAIDARFPKILRRVSGYNLDALLQDWDASHLDLTRLIVGSEGTLAIVAEAELNCVPLPACKGLLVPHFDSLKAALAYLPLILEHQPSAVELMDQMILDLARANLALKERMKGIQGRPAAVLMIEFIGESKSEVCHRLQRLQAALQSAPGVQNIVRAVEEKEREPLWRLRESGLPLLMGLPGDRKPISFVEDTAVAPHKLPEFVSAFERIIHQHGTQGAIYGHASVGCLHIRPVLNMKSAQDVATMRKISEQVVDLVMSFGGSLSGEHGDGLARSEWNRRLFGDELYSFMQNLKHTFDPKGLLNPGKIVDAPPMTDHLRIGPGYQAWEPATHFHFEEHGGFARSVELCSGTGVCRKTQAGVMCPSYRATLEEKDSTRGRANALRWAMTSPHPDADLRSDWLHDVLSLCLSCKACKSECPSNVDMARLKAEVDHFYYQTHPRPILDRLIKFLPMGLRIGSWLAPLINAVSTFPMSRTLLDQLAGIDRRRTLPRLASRSFHRWLRQHQARLHGEPSEKVLLYLDCFTNFQEPNIPMALAAILDRIGIAIEPWSGYCCGRPLISRGYLTDARRLVKDQAPRLCKTMEAHQSVWMMEPSCWSALADDWPALWPSPSTRQIASKVKLAEAGLKEDYGEALNQIPWRPLRQHALFHAHCHQKALAWSKSSSEVLSLIPELQRTDLDSGCCGMAGLFGFDKAYFEISVTIARQSLSRHVDDLPNSIVLSTGTSCRHQIMDVFHRQALHPLELLARQLPS